MASTGRDCAVNPPFILLASTQSVTIKLAQCMSVIYIGYMSDIFSKKYRIFSAFVKICHIFHNKVISYNLHVFSKKIKNMFLYRKTDRQISFFCAFM